MGVNSGNPPLDDFNVFDSISDSLKMIQLMDPTEIEEIRYEEAFMIKRLDSLVEEFMKEIDERAILLPKFIQTYWPRRMYEELSAKDKISYTQQKAIINLGVELLEDGEGQAMEVVVEEPDPLVDDYKERIQGLESIR